MTPSEHESRHALAARIGARYALEDTVRAVVLAGSVGAGRGDAGSDLDLYVYGDGELPVEVRRAVAQSLGAERLELDNRFIEPQLDRVLVHHEASIGYSTCFWANVLHSAIVFDRDGWFAQLARRAGQP